jgi:hypothetical protein
VLQVRQRPAQLHAPSSNHCQVKRLPSFTASSRIVPTAFRSSCYIDTDASLKNFLLYAYSKAMGWKEHNELYCSLAFRISCMHKCKIYSRCRAFCGPTPESYMSGARDRRRLRFVLRLSLGVRMATTDFDCCRLAVLGHALARPQEPARAAIGPLAHSSGPTAIWLFHSLNHH